MQQDGYTKLIKEESNFTTDLQAVYRHAIWERIDQLVSEADNRERKISLLGKPHRRTQYSDALKTAERECQAIQDEITRLEEVLKELRQG